MRAHSTSHQRHRPPTHFPPALTPYTHPLSRPPFTQVLDFFVDEGEDPSVAPLANAEGYAFSGAAGPGAGGYAFSECGGADLTIS